MAAGHPRWAGPLRVAFVALIAGMPQAALAERHYLLETTAFLRQVEERDGGETLVEERGVGVGIAAALNWPAGRWLLGVDGGLGHSEHDYDGATQLGAPLDTDTDWLEGHVGLNASRRFDALMGGSLGGTVRYQRRNRDIRSTPAAAGLEERYDTVWLGLGARMQPAPSTTLALDVACAIRSEVDVTFAADLDRVSLDLEDNCRAGLEARIDIGHIGRSTLFVRPFAVWERYPRSDAAALTSAGSPVGRVYLPDTELVTFGVSVGLAGRPD